MELREDRPLFEAKSTVDDHPQPDQPASPLKGKLLKIAGCLSTLSGTVFDAISLGCAQALGGYVPPFQLNLWRFLTQFVFCVTLVACLKQDIRIERTTIPYMLIVCLAFNVENVVMYSASVYLPLGTLGGFHGALYLMLTVTVAGIVNKQCPRLHTLVATLLVLTGVVLVTQPEFLFGDSEYMIHPVCPQQISTENVSCDFVTPLEENLTVTTAHSLGDNITGIVTTSSSTTGSTDTTPGYIYCVLAACSLVIIIFIINRKLQEVNPFVLSLWVGASGVIVSVIGMGLFETPMLPSHTSCQLLLAGHAIGVAVANILNTVGMLLTVPELYVLIHSMQLVFLFCAQYTVLQSVYPGHRNAVEISGAAGVALGNCVGPVHSLCEGANETDIVDETDAKETDDVDETERTTRDE